MLYSYAISSLSTIFTHNNNTYQAYKQKQLILRKINNDYELENKLNTKLRKYLKQQYRKIDLGLYEFINELSGKLKVELTMMMFHDQIKNLDFFQPRENEFILVVLPLLKSQLFRKKEILISVGEFFGEMYLISFGKISITLGSNYENIEIDTLQENQHFGDVLVQGNIPSPFDLICKSCSASTFILSNIDFFKIKELFPEKIIGSLETGFMKLESLLRRKKIYTKLFKLIKERFKLKRLIRKFEINLFSLGFQEFYHDNKNISSVNDYLSKEKYSKIKTIFLSLLNENRFDSDKGKDKLRKISNQIDEKAENTILKDNFSPHHTLNYFSDHNKKNSNFSFPAKRTRINQSILNELSCGNIVRKSLNIKKIKGKDSPLNSKRFVDYAKQLDFAVSGKKKEFYQSMETLIKEKTEKLFRKPSNIQIRKVTNISKVDSTEKNSINKKFRYEIQKTANFCLENQKIINEVSFEYLDEVKKNLLRMSRYFDNLNHYTLVNISSLKFNSQKNLDHVKLFSDLKQILSKLIELFSINKKDFGKNYLLKSDKFLFKICNHSEISHQSINQRLVMIYNKLDMLKK